LESDIPGRTLPLNIYAAPKEPLPVLLENKKVEKSGFDINRQGAVFKLVIPSEKKILHIMELGVEPDQTENLENINLSPKARFQIVIPFN